MTPAATAAHDILQTLLTQLGYTCRLTAGGDDPASPQLSIDADEADAQVLLGKEGAQLEDLQHLVNKLLRRKNPDAARVRLDVNGFRSGRDDAFLVEVRQAADEVRRTGQAIKLEPMNSYQRRLVHGLFKDDPTLKTWSPEDTSRMKRITILPRSV